MILRIALTLCLLVPATLGAVELPQAVTLAQARENYAKAIDETRAANLARRTKLHSGFDSALERLQKNFQSQSDIEKAIAVDKERERFAKEHTLVPSTIPEITNLQDILKKSLAPFEAELTAALDALRLRQVEVLTTLQKSLTSLGDTREAGATGDEIARLQSEIATAAPPPPAAPPASPAAEAPANFVIVPPEKTIDKSAIDEGQDVTESCSLQAGSYRIPKKIVVKKPTRDTKGGTVLYTRPGTVIRETRFLVGGGSVLHGHRTLFKDAGLRADLNGTVTGRDSLFDECVFDKGGNWYSRAFNAKWRLHNSVVSKSFIPKIRTKGHGFELRNTTFHRVDFTPFHYLEDSDAGTEAVHRWRTIDACKFVDCEIPLDLLICTTNCLFENCTFLEPEDPLPVKTPVKVTIYTGSNTPSPISANDKIVIEVLPPSDLPVPAGANLDYKITGTSLSFSDAP